MMVTWYCVSVMTVKRAFDNFILSRRLADLSTKTIQAYTMFVNPFIREVGSDKLLKEVNQEEINDYLSMVLDKPISKSTRCTYIRHLKIFLKWCSDNYDVCFDYKKVRVPKSPKKNVKIYSGEELKIIFDSIKCDIPWIELRNKCVVALMYDSGLRQSEVCGLLRSRVLFDKCVMTVTGKGNKDRIVPLGSMTAYYLRAYYSVCPYVSEYVFVSRTGQPLTNNAVKLFVNKLSDKLPFELSSHKLRHNFATNYCIDQYEHNGSIDIYKLMIILGHEDVETTRRYLHHANEFIATKNHISHLDLIFSKGV